jgi:hypothetical protein
LLSCRHARHCRTPTQYSKRNDVSEWRAPDWLTVLHVIRKHPCSKIRHELHYCMGICSYAVTCYHCMQSPEIPDELMQAFKDGESSGQVLVTYHETQPPTEGQCCADATSLLPCSVVACTASIHLGCQQLFRKRREDPRTPEPKVNFCVRHLQLEWDNHTATEVYSPEQ